MSAAGKTAQQLSEALTQLAVRNRPCDPVEWETVAETIRRLREHERLVRDVLPALRQRLDAAEGRPGAGA